MYFLESNSLRTFLILEECSESERHFFDVYCTSIKDASQSFNSIDIEEPTCFEINGEGLHNMS